jgi:hypothetical protein
MELFLALRIEYAKAHARARRYVEEEELVLEEMRRTLQYLRWKAGWWRSGDVEEVKVKIREGSKAYKEKQASLLDELRIKFEHMWRPVIADLKLSVEW